LIGVTPEIALQRMTSMKAEILLTTSISHINPKEAIGHRRIRAVIPVCLFALTIAFGACIDMTTFAQISFRKRILQARWCEDGHEDLSGLAVRFLDTFPSEADVINFKKFWDNLDFRAAA